MAKKLNEKLTTTHQFSVEGMLNVDALTDGIISAEIEEEGVKDLASFIKKFNGEYVKLVITTKTEELPEE